MADPSTTAPVDGDRDRGPVMMAIFISQTVVATIVVALRFHSRRLIRNIGWDDWLMLATLLLLIALAVICCYMASIGGCRHLFYIDSSTKHLTLKLQWIAQPFAIMSFATAKASIALFLLRVLPPTSFYRKWLVWATLVLSVIINSLGALFVFVQCNPPRKLWDMNVEGKCWDPKVQSNFEVFVGSWNAFIDILLAALPVTILWNLQMDRSKKLGLGIVLGLGGFAGICAAVKSSALRSLTARSDLTWETMPLFAWSGSETFLLIFCGSLPCLKPLYDLIFHGRSFSKYARSNYGSNSMHMKPTSGRHASSNSRSQRASSGPLAKGKWRGSVQLSKGADGTKASLGSVGGGGVEREGVDKARLVSSASPVPKVQVVSRAGSGDEEGDVPERGIRVQRDIIVRSDREEEVGWAV